MQVSDFLAIVLGITAVMLLYQLLRTKEILTRRMKELDRLRKEAALKVEQLELETSKFQLNPHLP